MALAAASDLLTMRISNALVGIVVVAFLAVALATGMDFSTFGLHFATGALMLVVTFSLFALGWIGGGDAKLTAAIALWFGPMLLLPFLLYASVFGGVLTLTILVGRRFALPSPMLRAGWIVRLHHPRTGIPYGIALALAAMLIYPSSPLFLALAS